LEPDKIIDDYEELLKTSVSFARHSFQQNWRQFNLEALKKH